MLFMVHHKHTVETCPAANVRPDKEFATRLDKQIREAGLKFEGYIDGPGHEFYFIFEADNIVKLYTALMELLKLGDNKIVPVMKFSETVAWAKKMGLQK